MHNYRANCRETGIRARSAYWKLPLALTLSRDLPSLGWEEEGVSAGASPFFPS
jgi:hypothetical protein